MLTELEEINFYNVKMAGTITNGIFELSKLRFLNLAYNSLSGTLADGKWDQLVSLEMIEL